MTLLLTWISPDAVVLAADRNIVHDPPGVPPVLVQEDARKLLWYASRDGKLPGSYCGLAELTVGEMRIPLEQWLSSTIERMPEGLSLQDAMHSLCAQLDEAVRRTRSLREFLPEQCRSWVVFTGFDLGSSAPIVVTMTNSEPIAYRLRDGAFRELRLEKPNQTRYGEFTLTVTGCAATSAVLAHGAHQLLVDEAGAFARRIGDLVSRGLSPQTVETVLAQMIDTAGAWSAKRTVSRSCHTAVIYRTSSDCEYRVHGESSTSTELSPWMVKPGGVAQMAMRNLDTVPVPPLLTTLGYQPTGPALEAFVDTDPLVRMLAGEVATRRLPPEVPAPPESPFAAEQLALVCQRAGIGDLAELKVLLEGLRDEAVAFVRAWSREQHAHAIDVASLVSMILARARRERFSPEVLRAHGWTWLQGPLDFDVSAWLSGASARPF